MPRKLLIKEVGGHRGDLVELDDGRRGKVLEFRPGYFSTHMLVEYGNELREVVRINDARIVEKGPGWKERKR